MKLNANRAIHFAMPDLDRRLFGRSVDAHDFAGVPLTRPTRQLNTGGAAMILPRARRTAPLATSLLAFALGWLVICEGVRADQPSSTQPKPSEVLSDVINRWADLIEPRA